MQTKCKKEVWVGFRHHPCGKNALPGGEYCGTHDPVRRAERQAKRGPTKFELECEERQRKAAQLETLRAEVAAFREMVREMAAMLQVNWNGGPQDRAVVSALSAALSEIGHPGDRQVGS